MPRRKKSGQSPARQPGGPPGQTPGQTPGHPLPPQGHDHGAMGSSSFPPDTPALSSAVKENIVQHMQEMFSHLDPEVIYIVLSECDFKVENAMDSLLELSVAAEVAVPVTTPVSGFERTAAALLSQRRLSETRSDKHSPRASAQPPSPPSPNQLTDDLDLLIDQELETLNAEQDFKEGRHSSALLTAGGPLVSFPPPLVPQQALPELLQSSLVAASRELCAEQPSLAGGSVEHFSGTSSSLNRLKTWEDEVPKKQSDVLDFSHLMKETSPEKPKPPLDLAASGRPSAFQVYKKQDSAGSVSEKTEQFNTTINGARSKVSSLNCNPHGYMSWNLEAPVFAPNFHGNQGPSFITPVAQTPSAWLNPTRHPFPWLNQGSISRAPLKPSTAVPKSWTQPAAPPGPAHSNRLRLQGKVLVLLRGAPGSGKSTLARALLEHNPGGVILTTDDYFLRNGEYHFNPRALGEAHEWNHKRAREAFERGANPIIIDNTNMQGWEMKPYVAQAPKHGYKVLFKEPDTWWRHKPKELVRRTTHNVHVESIRRMLDGYERFVTIPGIMGSHMPEYKQQLLQENKASQLVSSDTTCPDLIGQPGLAEGGNKSHPPLFSSLPDVSSISHPREDRIQKDGTPKSAESLNLLLDEGPTTNSDISDDDDDDDDDMDLGELDSELDSQLELNPPTGDHTIPDCIVESVMNEDYCADEIHDAFSESIGQRVRRERPSRRSGLNREESTDLLKDTNQPDKESSKDEDAEGGEEEREFQMLNFVGDWPSSSEGSLQQRQARTRGSNGKPHVKETQEGGSDDVSSAPDVTEFRKLLDLIQTGDAPVQTSSSHSRSVSPSSGKEFGREDEAGGAFMEANTSRSSSEERQPSVNSVGNSRRELPDCVLDGKAVDSCVSSDFRGDDWEGIKIENEASNIPERDPTTSDTHRKTEDLKLAVSRGDNEAGSLRIEDETNVQVDVDSNGCKNNDPGAEAGGGSGVGEICPVFEDSVESESSGSSYEKKQQQQQGRRSGKQCKLALTFTQNCPDASPNDPDCPSTTAANTDSAENVLIFDPQSCTSLDLYGECSSEEHLPLLDELGYFTQTEPQDFALLWRLNRPGNSDDTVLSASGRSSDIRVMYGDSSRFVPAELSAASAAANVPYRVVHERGTQVEEKELGVTQDRLESLHILSRHFRLVCFDTLEDLYDNCHQDLEWTTNLLLDSGERFFKDENAERDFADDDGYIMSRLVGDPCDAEETGKFPDLLDEHQHEGAEPEAEPTGTEDTARQVNKSADGASSTDASSVGSSSVGFTNEAQSDAISDVEKSPQTEVCLAKAVKELQRNDNADYNGISEPGLQAGAWGGSLDNVDTVKETGSEIEDDMASMDEINRLLQAELEEIEREGKQRKEKKLSGHLDIQTVELKLPTELALQLSELFGPVGVDPGTCSDDDFSVQMDLSLAKLLHQKWKETIQEKQRQASLCFHLLQENSQVAKNGSQLMSFLAGKDACTSLADQPEACSRMPYMDHWNIPRPHVSLRDIIKEEQALQETVQKSRQSRADLDKRDGATMLKEKQLYSLFPAIDQLFLLDIFRDHNYNLTQTELFLRSLLNEEPVKTVVAPEAPRTDHHRAASKDREKRQKAVESAVPDYQDTEYPEYEDFRAEASLQRKRRLESFSKAAEAFKQGHREVASFYAQQGHLHGQRMHEANRRAAVQIFDRVNASLLPKNILDLHGLHVDEALHHLAHVLQDKSADYERGLCQPQLSVITGRGNHSQGGVARIRPAVIDYLTNKHYRFTEPKPGLVMVSLK
ncbi:NEDD4-binding protein 2 [Cololabis saira]|uniref:NEDD4-binding protein 2 n=1 Tax=Cololabis saira TaxID=129043 RepID=UPI002AD37C5D|nr:NEDD4-binding protein 2 [Cololabis saira]